MHSALVRGGSDNITCALVHLAQPEMDRRETNDHDDTVPVFQYRN